MLQKISDRLAVYLAGVGVVKEDDREVVSFGLFRVLSDVEQVVILVAISLPAGLLPVMGPLLVFYGCLRRYIGGAHAQTRRLPGCVYHRSGSRCGGR